MTQDVTWADFKAGLAYDEGRECFYPSHGLGYAQAAGLGLGTLRVIETRAESAADHFAEFPELMRERLRELAAYAAEQIGKMEELMV